MAIGHQYFWSKWCTSILNMTPIHGGATRRLKIITHPQWRVSRISDILLLKITLNPASQKAEIWFKMNSVWRGINHVICPRGLGLSVVRWKSKIWKSWSKQTIIYKANAIYIYIYIYTHIRNIYGVCLSLYIYLSEFLVYQERSSDSRLQDVKQTR